MTPLPLEGKRVIVTRPAEQAGEMAGAIKDLGGIPVVIPMIRILPVEDPSPCDHALLALETMDAVVFTSANAVRYTMDRSAEIGISSAHWDGKEIYVVGSKTADAAKGYGLPVTMVPGEFSGAGLAAALSGRSLRDKRILLPRGNIGRDEVLHALTASGCDVVPVVVYRTAGPGEESARMMRQEILSHTMSVITFTSPSAARHFAGLFTDEELPAFRPRMIIAAIGATTREAITALQLPVHICADEATAPGLVTSIVSYFQSQHFP